MESKDMKISSEHWKAAWFWLLKSLCKYCTHAQRTHMTHTDTSCISLEEESTLTTTALGSPWLSVPILQPCRGETSPACWFWRFSDYPWLLCSSKPLWAKILHLFKSIRGITARQHVMAISPQCKYCFTVSDVSNPGYESNVFQFKKYPPNPALIFSKHDLPDDERHRY